jgi:hypothetical protein
LLFNEPEIVKQYFVRGLEIENRLIVPGILKKIKSFKEVCNVQEK